MLKFKTQILPISLAAGAMLVAGAGFAAVAIGPHQDIHSAAAAAVQAGDPVVLDMHNKMLGLAARLAHGAPLETIRPQMHELAVRYAAHSGQDLTDLEAHMEEMANLIIEARAEGPEALHALMTHLFGEGGHG